MSSSQERLHDACPLPLMDLEVLYDLLVGGSLEFESSFNFAFRSRLSELTGRK